MVALVGECASGASYRLPIKKEKATGGLHISHPGGLSNSTRKLEAPNSGSALVPLGREGATAKDLRQVPKARGVGSTLL